MISTLTQSSATSLSIKPDQTEISLPRHSSIRSLSESDLIAEYTFKEKLKSVMQWFLNPFQQCCSSNPKTPKKTKYQSNPQCLKPEYNRVNGLLKYFAFGVMFTNGILGFIIFLIGLWSSFEHRKITHMPRINSQDETSLNPFNFIGIILCIFGLLFFLLCIISSLGINRENLNLLRISLIGQFLTLILFLIFAIIILIWGEKVRDKIAEAMTIGLKLHYHVDEAWTAFFDKLHMNYFCCGVYSFNDWNENPNYACTSLNILQSFDACSVPFTCCKTEHKENDRQVNIRSVAYTCGVNILPSDNKTINMDEIQERINVNGCFDEILPVIQQLLITAAIFLLLICIIVFATIFLTCLLTFEIRLTISDVERNCRKTRRTDDDDHSEKEEEKF